MASDQKHEETGKLPGKEDNPPQSTSRRASNNEFLSPQDPAHNQEPENLPSYEYNPPPPSRLLPTSTSSSLRPSQVPTLSPTPSNFSQPTFPTSTPPPYYPPHSTHLLAIPQTSPHATSPLLPSYAPILHAHGIPASTWLSFLSTLSAHLTARTSQRLLAHASDVPKQLGKDLLSTGAATGKNIARSAKHLNPGGVLGGVLGFTFGVTGALVRVPGAAVGRPRTGVERVREGMGEANREWLHGRGLHVELLGLRELVGRVGGTVEEMWGGGGERSAGEEMQRLRPWVGEVVVGTGEALEGRRKRGSGEIGGDAKDRRSFVRGAESVGMSVTGSLSVEGPGERVREGEASGQDAGLVLELGPETLWLVVSRWEKGAAA